MQVNQRAAGISGIDGRVGLNEIFVIFDGAAEAAALRAHDSHRDGFADAERIADGQDYVADFDFEESPTVR